MRVAIIGAGVAGLATAKVLTQAGHEVVVFDKTPDVGGVWSRTRRYPGLTTQSPKAQYSLSDFPMPKSYPEWPSGEQVQAYLAGYAAHFGLDARAAAEHRGGRRPPGRRRLDPRHPRRRRRRRGSDDHRRVRPPGRRQRRVLRARDPGLPRPRGVRGGRRPAAGGHRTPRRRAGQGQARPRGRLRQVRLRRHRPDQRGRRQHRRDRPAAAVEGARGRSTASSTSRCCC